MTTREDCERWDAEDGLARFRKAFALPEGVIYFDGNSLGALPVKTPGRVRNLIEEEWGKDLIRSWNSHAWIHYPRRIGDKIAKLIGASSGEVVAADSTSVNLFKLLGASLRLQPEARRVIVSERTNFPTDLYIAQGLVEMADHRYELRMVEASELETAVDATVAAVMLTHVNFRSGDRHDMAGITRLAHGEGAIMLWDLSHSAGAMPLKVNKDGVDLAVGCGYKYLNGGPGAPAFLYVSRRLQTALRPPLSGWMGHEAPFAFDADYRPAPGVERHLCGTPSILGMAALEVGVDLLLEADLGEVREKSERLGDLFIELVEARCGKFPISVACPRDRALRGSQVSFRHDDGYAIMQALIARGVIGDFRDPDILRFGLTPLYLGYADAWDAVAALREILETEAWRDVAFQKRQLVT